MATKQALLRQLPAIGTILEERRIKELGEYNPHVIISEAAAEVVQEIRQAVLDSAGHESEQRDYDLENIINMVEQRVAQKMRPHLRPVINATGIVLHTNLGRAVLAQEAVRAVNEVAARYSNLEFDLETGERGSRYSHVEDLLCRLTGAEAGLVVNNNAAAVLLVLSALAGDRQVIVSRGQLVEIGGSFRIPDVMKQSGAILVEVGTTNKTHLPDYARAVNEETALLLKVHTSNYKIIGFTAEVSAPELVKLGREHGIPVYEDLGSGVLVDFSRFGLTHEPTVRESVAAGVDVVTCSGDKLFGGPQGGIIVGRQELIGKIKRHPLTRALRVDKFTLAAMEATLRLYFDEAQAVTRIPTLAMITLTREELRRRAERLAVCIREKAPAACEIEIVDGYSQVGGGALPEENIPTCLVAVNPLNIAVNQLEEKLRFMDPPVLARIQKERLLLDPRTLLEGDMELIACHLKKILQGGEQYGQG